MSIQPLPTEDISPLSPAMPAALPLKAKKATLAPYMRGHVSSEVLHLRIERIPSLTLRQRPSQG